MRFLRALGYCFEEAVVELWRNRLVNLISIATIAVSLFILGIFLSVSANLNELMMGWAGRVQLTLYVDDDLSTLERERLDGFLGDAGEVESYEFVSKEEAVSRFRSYFPELENLPELLEANPLPASYEVRVAEGHRDPIQVRVFASRLGILGGVTEVEYDLLWIERLTAIIDLVRILGLAIGSALVIASMFTIFNVIKLTVYGRQEEIGIMRLVGATHAYIRGPFLVEGVLQGGVGGALALLLLYAAHELVLRAAVDAFQLLPAKDWFHFVSAAASAAIVGGGMFVGLVGSLLSVRKLLSSPV